MTYTIQLRRDTVADWTSVNPTLAQGEPGVETDTGKFKIGDGITAWNDLPYAGGAGGLVPPVSWGWPGIGLEYNGSLYTPPGPGSFTMPMDTAYSLDGSSTSPVDDAVMTWDGSTGAMVVKQAGWYQLSYNLRFDVPVVGGDATHEPVVSWSSIFPHADVPLFGRRYVREINVVYIFANAGVGMQPKYLLDAPDGPDPEDKIAYAFFALTPLFEVAT